MGYVRTIVRRQVAAQIDNTVQARRSQVALDIGALLSDHHPDPERQIIEQEQVASPCASSTATPSATARF